MCASCEGVHASRAGSASERPYATDRPAGLGAEAAGHRVAGGGGVAGLERREDGEAPGTSSQAASPPISPGFPGGPVAARVVATCAFHPGVRAVTRCAGCGALICAGCQRIAGQKRYCEYCFEKVVGKRGRAAFGERRAAGLPRQLAVSWKIWPGMAFLPVPFLLSGLMTYMMRQGEEVSIGAAQLLISLVLYSSTVAFALLVVSRHGDTARELGMHTKELPRSLGMGIVCGALVFWIAVASSYLSVGVFHRLGSIERWLQGFFDVNARNATGTDLLIAGLVIVLAAPVCEEIFFRGYLYPAMRERMGVWGAAALNGFLFSAVHFSLYGLLGRTIAGMLFCLVYEYTDNLWSPVAAHTINNFVAFFLPLAAMLS